MNRSEVLRKQTIECSPLRGHSLNQYKIKKAFEGEIRVDGLRGKIGRIMRRQARRALTLSSEFSDISVQEETIVFNIGGSFRRRF